MGRASKNARKASPVASRKVKRKTTRCPFWERLVQQLQDLEIDVSVFQAQITDKSPACVLFLDKVDDKAEKNPDLSSIDSSIYWFIIITNALKTLLPLASLEDALAATDLAVQWTDLFIGQKPNSTASSRSLLGHAILVVTEVCTQAISRYHDNMEIMLASIISLDAVSVASSYDKTDWANGVLSSWREYLNNTEHVFPTKKTSWAKLEACLDAFESKNFNAFLQMPRLPLTDTRLALKRWSPVFVTWFGGQEIICNALLEMVSASADYSGCDRVIPMSNNKKNRSVVSVPIPSVVTLLTMIGRLCRILATGSSVGGTKGPGGNFNTYVKDLSGRVETTPKSDHAFTILLKKCLERHADSTTNWVQTDAAVINCMKWKVPESSKLVTKVPEFFTNVASFYPFMTMLVTDIESMVSNKIIHPLSMSWILKGPIKDVSLCKWAILHLMAEIESLPATNEPLDAFLTVSSSQKQCSGKSKLRKRKKDTSSSDDSDLLSDLLGKTNHTQHERFALFVCQTPNIVDSLLRLLWVLYDALGETSVTSNQRETSTKKLGSHGYVLETSFIDSTRIQHVRTVLELTKTLMQFDTTSCTLRGLLASKFGWGELRKLVLYAPLLSKALDQHVALDTDTALQLKSLWEYHTSLFANIGRQDFRQELVRMSNTNGEWEVLLSGISDQSYKHSKHSWPLTLDSSFQIMIGTFLKHQSPNLGMATGSIIVKGIVAELRGVFSSPDSLIKYMESKPKNSPLLARDYSKMVLFSFSKMQTNDQKDALRAILDVLKSFLDTEQCFEKICEESPAVDFVARVITLCFSCYVVMRFRHETNTLMRDFKFESLEAKQVDETSLGLFVEESFRLPISDVDSLLQDDISVSSKLQNVLEQAFTLAVSQELYDENLILAFAAYNALGLSAIWDTRDLVIHQARAFDETKLPLAVLQLRSDMCLLVVKCRKFDHSSPGPSTLERLLTMKLSNNVTIKEIWTDIRALLRNAMGLVERITMSNDDKASKPIAIVGLDVALSCISFALSCCSKSQSSIDIISMLSDRNRRDSFESDDAVISDVGSIGSQGSDPTSDGARRLRNIIDAISSAPCHPDWLDESCSLRPGIDIMIETGNALKCIRRLIDFSRNQIRLTRVRLLKEHNSSLTDQDIDVIIDLLSFREQVLRRNYSENCDDLLSSVCLAFNCQETFLQRITSIEVSKSSKPRELTALKCAHLIRTVDSSTKYAYHRATRNWEAILALAFTVPAKSFLVNSNEDQGCHHLQMWATLQDHALSHMIPATALYRFSLANRGRRQHPLVHYVSGSAGSASFFNMDGGDGFPFHSKQKMGKRPAVALWILEVLSELPLTNASRCSANHLMKDQEDFLVLNETARLELSFKILVALKSHTNIPTINRVVDQVSRDIARSSIRAIATTLGASAPIAPDVVDKRKTSLNEKPISRPERLQVLFQYLFQEISEKIGHRIFERIIVIPSILSIALDYGEKHQSTDLLDVVTQLLSQSEPDDLANLVRLALGVSPVESQIDRSALIMTFGRMFAKRSHYTSKMALQLWPIIEVCLDDVHLFSTNEQESVMCVALLCSLQCNKILEFGSILMSMVSPSTLASANAHHRCRLVKIYFSFLAGLGRLLKETEVAYEKSSIQLAGKGEGALYRLPDTCTYVTDNDFQDQHWYNCVTCGLVGDKGCCSLCAVVCHAGHEVSYSRYGSFLCDCGEMSVSCSDGKQATTRCQCLSPVTQQPRDKPGLSEPFVAFPGKGERKKTDVLSIKKALELLNFSGQNRTEILEAYDKFTAHGTTTSWTKSLFDMANKALIRWNHRATADLTSEAGTSGILYGKNGDSFLNEIPSKLGFTPRFASKDQAKPLRCIGYNRIGYLVVAEDGFLSVYSWHLVCADSLESWSPSPIPLYKISTNVAVLGLVFSPWNEKCLLFWGDNTVKIGLFDNTWRSFKKTLLITTVSEKTDELVGCSWVNEHHVLVWTSRHICLYEVEKEANSVSLCQEKIICPVPPRGVAVLSNSPAFHSIFAAQEDGKILKLSLSINEAGNQHLSEMFTEALVDDMPCRTLLYIEDERILLCEASGAGIFSTTVGPDLKFGPQFLLLPPKLDMLGKEKRLGAPYSEMRYLGSTRDGEGASFHTICCLATRSSKKGASDQLVVVRFNKSKVLVDECNQEGTQVLGLATCSFPNVKNRTENVVVATAMLSGEIRFSIGSTGNCILNNIQPTAATQRICRTRDHSNLGVGLLSFEDMKNASACPSIQYGTSDSTLESDALKQLLSPDHTENLAGKQSEGFSIFMFRVPCKDDANINGDAIVALRMLLGSSPDSTPTEAAVFGRKIVVDNKCQRWYPIILSPSEIATVARSGFLSVEIGPTAQKSLPPVVDGLEVYVDVDNHGGSEYILPFCLSRDDASKERDANRNCLLFLLQSLRDLKMKTIALKASKAEKSLIRKAVEATALSSDVELGDVAVSMVSSIEGDLRSRLAFQDKSILKACFLFLSQCMSRLNKFHGKQQLLEWTSLNPMLRSCLRASSGIARARPYNYLQIADESSGEIRSIAFDASGLMVDFLTNFPSNDLLLVDLVDVLLFELAVVSGTPRGRFGSFDGLQRLLSSSNKRVVNLTCLSISKFCEKNDIFSAEKLAVEYVCDSCFRVIANTRFSIEVSDAVFDLCPDCFSKGQEFARKQENNQSHVLVSGRIIGSSPKLTCAALLSMRKVEKNSSRNMGITDDGASHPQQLHAAFMDGLCRGLSNLLQQKMSRPSWQIIELCANLISHGFGTRKGSTDAKTLLLSIVDILELKLADGVDMSYGRLHTVLLLLEGLAAIIVRDKHVRRFFSGTESDFVSCDAIGKSSEVSCPVHLTRCGLRMFSGDKNRGRRFYCCESGESCLFFRWNDDRTCQDLTVPSENLRRYILELLQRTNVDGQSVLLQLRASVSQFVFAEVEHEAEPETVEETLDNCNRAILSSGVLCPLTQFDNIAAINSLATAKDDDEHGPPRQPIQKLKEGIVQSSLEILTLLASADTSLDDPWLPLLSRIALNSKDLKAQTAATTAIRRMVGKSKHRSVLEHFSHMIQVEKLVESGRPFLQYASVLTKKAAICASLEQKNWDQVESSDLVGMNYLVSDDVAFSNGLMLYKAVSEILLEISKSQQKSWANFCSSEHNSSDHRDIAPIRIVFCLVCTCPLHLNGKLLRILNAAVTSENAKAISDILRLSNSSLVCFVERFVLNGYSADIRNTAVQFVSKVFSSLDQKDRLEVTSFLITDVMKDVGKIGRRSSDFFGLLHEVLGMIEDLPDIDMESLSSFSFNCFVSQSISTVEGRANGDYTYLETRTSSAFQKRRFELSRCSSCRLQMKSKSKTDPCKKDKLGTSALMQKSTVDSSKQKTAPEQMTPSIRGRLAVNRENTVSDEFSTFIALKHRIAISAVHLEVENSRREVKLINIYFSPRPVDSAEKLKLPEYCEKWQLCATLKLSKTLTRVNFTLPSPVVAANLRIEYAEFADRDGATENGKFALCCPRCSGNVTNVHGLCTNCGEVAFQCRKCRHINYDRVDAFLCVECGYCSSGNFRFDLTAGYATNAIAITNDGEYDRAKEMLKVARSCYENLRTALRQKLGLLMGTKRKDTALFQKSSFRLRRAFGGSLPIHFQEADVDDDYSRLTMSDLGKAGTVLQRVACYENSQERWPPTCSGFECHSSHGNDARTSGTMQHTANDDGEEESTCDIINNLLENGGLGGRYGSSLDSNDPLSRLLASVRGRQLRPSERKSGDVGRVRVASEEDGKSGGGEKGRKKEDVDRSSEKHSNTKASIEVCDRLYLLMQEAEREVYELEQRCNAWERLNSGNLSCLGRRDDHFEPSHCCSCQPSIAISMLTWWHALFKRAPRNVSVTKEMIQTLLGEQLSGHSSGTKTLQGRVRDVISDIALLSPEGRTILLDLLRDRMMIFGDNRSAQVLGCILERMGEENEVSSPFLALAREALGSFRN